MPSLMAIERSSSLIIGNGNSVLEIPAYCLISSDQIRLSSTDEQVSAIVFTPRLSNSPWSLATVDKSVVQIGVNARV